MKLIRKRFLLIVALAFATVFGWTLFSRNFALQEGVKRYASSSPNGSKSLPATAAAVVSRNEPPSNQQQQQKIRNIVCNINGEYKVNCLKVLKDANKESVYVPFSLIHKYFEINGKLVPAKSSSSAETFEWAHSYSKIFYPSEPYNTRGPFLWFANYNVEARERVKCVSAIDGVPMSTQWFAAGHFYPTQIAQYGLSHFSKNLTEGGEESSPQRSFDLLKAGNNVTSRPELAKVASSGGDEVQITANTTLYLPEDAFPQHNLFILDLNLQLHGPCAISVYIAAATSGESSNEMIEESLLVLQYATVKEHLRRGSRQYRMAVYGLGEEDKSSSRTSGEWRSLTRDLLVDLLKGGLIDGGAGRNRRNSLASSYRVVRIELTGRMSLRGARLLSSAHHQFALAAGDWLVRKQNSQTGGWPVQVRRRLQKASGGPALVLEAGWHSSMAQGQAISLLARLYGVTGKTAYLEAAKRALAVFEVESFRGGVRALFLDRYVWYEEYPTVPSIFVLNGFIYSLFGLYDLGQVCGGSAPLQEQVVAEKVKEEEDACKRANVLFEEGVRSLEALLALYDSGSGSFYDLRHYSLAGAVAPNVARWDYHSTHINQLLALYSVVRRDVFSSTAHRWIAYMKGHRAPHN